MENINQQPKQEAKQEVKQETPKSDKSVQEQLTLSQAENIKLKQRLADLNYVDSGLDNKYRDWVQTILEKEKKNLYDNNVKEYLKDKKFDVFRNSKKDIDSKHINNFNAEQLKNVDGKQQPKRELSKEELDKIQIDIPGFDK